MGPRGKDVLPRHAHGAVEYAFEALEAAKDLLFVLTRVGSSPVRAAVVESCGRVLRCVAKVRAVAGDRGPHLPRRAELDDALRVLLMVWEVERRRGAGGGAGLEWTAGIDPRFFVPLKALVEAPDGEWAEQARGYRVLQRQLTREGRLTSEGAAVLTAVMESCDALCERREDTFEPVKDLLAILDRVRSSAARALLVEACGRLVKSLSERSSSEGPLTAAEMESAIHVLRVVWDVERRRAADAAPDWTAVPEPRFVLGVKALVSTPPGDWRGQAAGFRALRRQFADAGVLDAGAAFVLTAVIKSCEALAVDQDVVR